MTEEKINKRVKSLNNQVPKGSPINYDALLYKDRWVVRQLCNGQPVGIVS